MAVLDNLATCAWYCALLIPAANVPDSSATVSALTESGERPLCIVSLLHDCCGMCTCCKPALSCTPTYNPCYTMHAFHLLQAYQKQLQRPAL
jgi:hypothetical protein